MSAKDVKPTEPAGSTDTDGGEEAEATEAPADTAAQRQARRKTGRITRWSDRNLKTDVVAITW